jgi:hypothetical protein
MSSDKGKDPPMTLWRIRVAVPDGPGGHGALTEALAGQPVSGIRVVPGRTAASSTSSEIVVDLPHDDGLATVLSALHEISPQVFVSRADVTEEQEVPGPGVPARYGV